MWIYFCSRIYANCKNSDSLKAKFERQIIICLATWVVRHLLIALDSVCAFLLSLFLLRIDHSDLHKESSSFHMPRNALITMFVITVLCVCKYIYLCVIFIGAMKYVSYIQIHSMWIISIHPSRLSHLSKAKFGGFN